MTDTEMVTPAAGQTGDSGLSFAGLVQVFYKPEEFFKKLVEKPKVLVPYIVIGVLMFIFLFSIRGLVWDMVSTSARFQERMQNSGATAEQVKGIIMMSTVGFGMVAALIGPLVLALVALFWGNFVFAGKATFTQLLSVVLYGEVIYAVGAIVNLALILPRQNLMANLSLGVLATSQGPESWLYTILSKVAVFYIWELVAVGIGFAVLYKTKRGQGYRLSILSLGLVTVLGIVFGKLFN